MTTKTVVHYEVHCSRCRKIVLMKGTIEEFNKIRYCPRCGGYPVKPTIAQIVDVEEEKKDEK